MKNPLYNLSGRNGRVLSARLCIVGVVTCPDDGWKALQSDVGGEGYSILDSLQGGRYRLPSLTARTRLNAFAGAFDEANIALDQAARRKLPVAAASAAWAKGKAFRRVAAQLLQLTSDSETGKVSASDVEVALASTRRGSAAFAEVSFHSQEDEQTSEMESASVFSSVGGNMDAKVSLEDALALDPGKRRMLQRFGLSPPSGILLYGPPGCGKTLLAKAVASLLQGTISHGDDSYALGGTFISLSSSDIVRAEIGTSEKMLISAFEVAEKNAPSVIFLDEFQALFTERSRGGSGKLATTLLQCMDDLRTFDKAKDIENSEIEPVLGRNRVVVLGATNTPWMVDSAFLRPGRFYKWR